jgi:glutamate-1-semialdehyde 2,1-aminomutase
VSLTPPARSSRSVLDATRLAFLTGREEQRFLADRPRSRALLDRARAHMPGGVPMAWMTAMHGHPPVFAAEGEGAWFTDVDGHRYLDMNQADLSMNAGFGPPAVVAAVSDRMRRGSQFMLPTEDALWCAEELADRWELPYWQFTLSASGANTEIIRLARHVSGRDKILMFDGKYHGHIEDSLVIMAEGTVKPELYGLSSAAAARARMVPFNDLDAAERALAGRDVALCIVEPALTNVGVVMPAEGFHAGLRELTRRYGTFLALDETHTQIASPGGLKRLWKLEADAVGLGKSIGGGVPIGAYGLCEALAQPLKNPPLMPGAPMESVGGVATGGTLYGNALSMAACRATLSQVLTPQGFVRTAALGAQLADGLAGLFAAGSLDWQVHRLASRSGFTFAGHLPRNAAEARALAQPAFYRLLRLWMANRGVWESVATAGPTVSFAMAEAEVAFYLERMREFLADIL